MDEFISNILLLENIDKELYYVAIINGANCKTLQSFLGEIGKALKFPSYYSRNLSSLDECINDLEWLDKPNYILIIHNSKEFLKSESIDLRDHILTFLTNVSREWANVPNFKGEELQRRKADFRIKMH